MRKLLFGTVAALTFSTGSASAMQYRYIDAGNNVGVVVLTGKIEPGDADRLAIWAKANAPGDFISLALNSPGGSVLEALKIASAIKKFGISTMVAPGEQCSSACFFMFAAGKERFASNRASINVHSLSTINAGEDDSAKSSTVDIARFCSEELKVPPSIIGHMVSTPTNGSYRLTLADLAEMGVRVTQDAAPVAPVPTAPAQIVSTRIPDKDLSDDLATILNAERAENEKCRGGSGDDSVTWQHCAARDALEEKLKRLGMCYGEPGQPGYQQVWHACDKQTQAVPPASPMFQKGLSDRASWENWIAGISSDYRTGAEYWAGQRSLSHPGSCNGVPDFTAGCREAQARLAPVDVLRKSEPDYKAGWNSYGH